MDDSLVFLRVNVKHYAHAFLGIGCAFLPNAPELRGFFYPTIIQSVLEYRAYVLVIPVAVILARAFPSFSYFIAGYWIAVSVRRLYSFRSGLAFWEKLWQESPHERTRLHYTEELIREIEKKMKIGQSAEREIALVNQLIETTVKKEG